MTTNAKLDAPADEAWGDYVQRPVNVKAFQFDPLGVHRLRLPDRIRGVPGAGADNWAYDGCQFYVDTVIGEQEIYPGDWIVVTSDGNWRACRAAVFAHNFAPVPKAKPTGYGSCPTCGAQCISRERRLNGNDTCSRGHIYPSSTAVH